MLGIGIGVFILACAHALPSSVHLTNVGTVTNQHFDIVQRIARDGYYSESHDVITSDGYILEINRIPFSRFETSDNSPVPRPVVFLMPGLHNSAISYITLGPGLSLAHTLADAGYDVWIGNPRGILNSRRHVSLNPDNRWNRRRFFDYSFDDIGTKDLPAMLDYILEVTGQTQLNYIGHSQGGTAFLVLNSCKPEYNKIFKSAHLLAGVGYKRHFPSIALGLVAQRTDSIYETAVKLGTTEVGFVPPINNENIKYFENNSDMATNFPPLVAEAMSGLPLEMMAGASMKQYAHFGQNVRDRGFRRWNYGTMGNLLAYGRINPPTYDLSLINVDITLHYTVGDILLSVRDVLDMARTMPNAKTRRVARENFTHTDFVIAPDSKVLVNDFIIKELNKRNK